MTTHMWEPLGGLDPGSSSVDFREIDSLQKQWLSFRKQREESVPNAYQAFLERLDRRWAIETGIIEGLYNIDRGTTQTLVENGLNAELIDRTATDRDPYELIKVLEDHKDTAEFVTSSIRQDTPLSKQYIRELHQLLTRNQPVYTAVDQFGRTFETELDRGGFKKQPNNPTRSNGLIHEYCPPAQVDSEIDNLVNYYGEFEQARDCFHRIHVAAWLDHRFTQIHPFQDGNGRVARALLTWHLVKERYLPIVVSRDDRPRYIECLEAADAGDLNPFVQFIIGLETRVILEAFDEPEPVEAASMVSQVVGHIAERIGRQHQERLAQRRSVNGVASSLRNTASLYLESHAESIRKQFSDAGLPVECVIDQGGPDDKEYWYRAQVMQTAREAGHWANLNEDRFFVKLSINPDAESRTPKLIFVTSFHHVGRQLTGIMAATAFAQIVGVQDARSRELEESAGPDIWNCTEDTFTFSWQDDAVAVAARFTNWIEAPLSLALRHWSESIS